MSYAIINIHGEYQDNIFNVNDFANWYAQNRDEVGDQTLFALVNFEERKAFVAEVTTDPTVTLF